MRVSWEDLFCEQLKITQRIREELTDTQMLVETLEEVNRDQKEELERRYDRFDMDSWRMNKLQPYISKMFGWANFYNWVEKEAK